MVKLWNQFNDQWIVVQGAESVLPARGLQLYSIEGFWDTTREKTYWHPPIWVLVTIYWLNLAQVPWVPEERHRSMKAEKTKASPVIHTPCRFMRAQTKKKPEWEIGEAVCWSDALHIRYQTHPKQSVFNHMHPFQRNTKLSAFRFTIRRFVHRWSVIKTWFFVTKNMSPTLLTQSIFPSQTPSANIEQV